MPNDGGYRRVSHCDRHRISPAAFFAVVTTENIQAGFYTFLLVITEPPP
jgi:hypothetical protein